jgi:hypothetical protein
LPGRGRGWCGARRGWRRKAAAELLPPVARHLVALAEEAEHVDGVRAGEGHRDDLVEHAQEEQVLARLARQLWLLRLARGRASCACRTCWCPCPCWRPAAGARAAGGGRGPGGGAPVRGSAAARPQGACDAASQGDRKERRRDLRGRTLSGGIQRARSNVLLITKNNKILPAQL